MALLTACRPEVEDDPLPQSDMPAPDLAQTDMDQTDMAPTDMARPDKASPPDPGTCPLDMGLLGRPESVLAVMDFAQDTRIYRTGDAVTMDFRPDRLNIEIGPEGTIVRVTCG